jgi:hypothetical protein
MEHLADLETLPSRVCTAVAGDINKLLQDEFTGEHDPYGEPWARNAPSTVAKKGFDQPMYETGETGRETRAVALGGAGIEIRTTEKAGYNQFARDGVPARPVLPAQAELPEEWQDAIQKRISEAMKGRK